MNQMQITEKLNIATEGKPYQGSLTSYAVESITKSRSNYPVSNLIAYCHDSNLKMIMMDIATEDKFYPATLLDVHRTLCFLMDRYEVDCQLIYRKTAVHYTAPKTFDENELKNTKQATPLSVKTLIAVCEVIHCDLQFESN